MDIYKELGANIRLFRHKLSMTQAELSARSGVSTSFLGHIERGTRKLSVDTLARLARTLGASLDQLIPSVWESCGLSRPIYSREDVQKALEPLHKMLRG